jgi:hypothetical protein
MGDYANTILLAWPYPGEQALPDELRDLLETEAWLPDLDSPVAELEENETVVLAGEEHSGRILAISDTEANGGTARFSDLITALTNAGMSVYAANDAGDDYDAWNVYYLVGADGHVTEQHRSMVAGEIVVSASDLTGADEYVAQLDDGELGARARRLLDHPPLPAAVRALTRAIGPRTRDGAAGTGADAG